jgi:alpha-1,2-mannosyltransferase
VPKGNWLFSGHYALGFGDLRSRFKDIWRLHHGFNLYSNHDHHQYFTYPPAALFVFWPLSWASLRVDFLVWTLLTETALAATIALCWAKVRPGRPWLIAAGSIWGALASFAIFPPLSIHLAVGQLGIFLALMLALDYLAVRGLARGVLTGVAAAIKIYPIVFIVAFALRREWRAAGTALASGAATTALAWAVWPSATWTFFHRQLFSGGELNHFLKNHHWIATSSSPYTVFFRWPFSGGTGAGALGWAASLAVVALGLWAGQRLWRRRRHVSSFVMVLGASVLAGPVTWDHYYTFAPLMVFVVLENLDLAVLAWTAGAAMVLYAVPWQLARNESLSVHGFSARAGLILLARNALSLATLATAVAAIYATRSDRERVDESVSPGP